MIALVIFFLISIVVGFVFLNIATAVFELIDGKPLSQIRKDRLEFYHKIGRQLRS